MNAFTEQRLAIARARVVPFINDPNIRAIMVTGSVADGHTDDASDIDIILFLEQAVSEEVFQAACDSAIQSGGGVHFGTAKDGFAVYEYIDGIRVDLGFNFIAETEEIVTGITERAETDLVHQLVVTGIQKAVVLHGEALIAGWRARLAQYPPALGEAMIKTYLRFHSRWIMQRMGVERDETMWMNEVFLDAAKNLVAALCAVNGLYHPGKWKGVGHTIDKMQHKPDRLLARLEGMFTAPLAQAVIDLDALILEVIALVETRLPQVDISRAKSRYTVARVR